MEENAETKVMISKRKLCGALTRKWIERPTIPINKEVNALKKVTLLERWSFM